MQQRYTDEKLKDHAEWAENYSADHRRDAVRVAHYYASNPPYFQNLVRRVMDDPTCILSINDYNKFRQEQNMMVEGSDSIYLVTSMLSKTSCSANYLIDNEIITYTVIV